jgi:hypothetical protein
MLSLVLNDYVDASFPDRLDEGPVVTLVLVGIFNRELTNCVACPSRIKKVFRSSTQFSLAGYRTQLFNPEDIPEDIENVKKSQAGTRCSRCPPI